MAKVIARSDTHTGLRDKLNTALKAKHNSGSSYTYDDPYVSDVTDDKVIHSMPGQDKRGKLYASPYKKSDVGEVTLGDPKEVEPAYKPMAESERGLVMEAADTFAEAAMTAPTAKTRELTVTVIKPGFNKSKSRFYSQKALRETGHVFKGAKVFINHQTKAEEAARPEGRVQDWAGTLTGDIYEAADGSLKSKCVVHHEETIKTLDALKEAGKLGEMGMSIRAAGVQTPATVKGTKCLMVESFVVCKSVDMVTFPGAGGKVDSMAESAGHILTESELEAVFSESEANDIDTMPLSILRERRPDLVQSITKEVRESINMEKTVEELKTELAESERKRLEAEGKLTESDKTTKKAAVKTELDTQLKEAGLPKVAEDRVRAQFAEATDPAGIKAAVEAEKTYLKEAGIAAKPGVRGLGEMREAGDPAAKQTRAEYVTAMSKTPGFTKEMAEASADHLGL